MGLFNFLFGNLEECKEEPKTKTVKDFFNIDIKNIMSYNPSFSHSSTNAIGREINHYNLYLDKLELGIFNEIDILEVAENEYNLTFKSLYNEITPELTEFIKFYTDTYGLDTNGEGYINQKDLYYVERHLFSRFWNSLTIDNNELNDSYGNIEMCLMGIKHL